jgi:hypothetical protein
MGSALFRYLTKHDPMLRELGELMVQMHSALQEMKRSQALLLETTERLVHLTDVLDKELACLRSVEDSMIDRATHICNALELEDNDDGSSTEHDENDGIIFDERQ